MKNMDIYIYYRVAKSNAIALQQRVTLLQRHLTQRHHIQTYLKKRRPEEHDGYGTWMEIYLNTPPDFETTLQRAVDADNLASLIEGSRHIERFVDAGDLSCA